MRGRDIQSPMELIVFVALDTREAEGLTVIDELRVVGGEATVEGRELTAAAAAAAAAGLSVRRLEFASQALFVSLIGNSRGARGLELRSERDD